jgi:hypothetical protein
MRLVLILLAAYLVCPWAVAAGASSINLSRDLVSLGVAGQNISPNNPSLDAQPLFQAALKYARAHRIRTVTVDHGAYYSVAGFGLVAPKGL